MRRPKVMFLCTGVGIFNRGIETFFREAFDGLKTQEGVELFLAKGGGAEKKDERVLWNLPRTGKVSQMLGRVVHRNGYVVEQLTAFPTAAALIRRERPDVIFYSDSNLGFQLYRWREQIGVPYKLLFSNGGPCSPPFVRTDYVHQVAPFYLEEALRAGEPENKHFMIPYGVKVPEKPVRSPELVQRSRKQLGLPAERAIVLSVGWIAREHKRMHYVIEEVARLAKPRPFLLLLGAMDANSKEIVELGRRLLGEENFDVRSVPAEEVSAYYRASDVFALASLAEGFGRVYIEALMHGLPVIAHQHPVMEYVLGGEGRLGNLAEGGTLATLLEEALAETSSDQRLEQRWHSVKERFSWDALAPAYVRMFGQCA